MRLPKASSKYGIRFVIIPHKILFMDFSYILGTVSLRYNSLLVRTTSIACTILCQRIFVLNLTILSVVLGKSLQKNSCSYSSDKTGEVINEGFTSQQKCMTSCLTACLNQIKVLIGQHFFCYFKENLGTHLKAH